MARDVSREKCRASHATYKDTEETQVVRKEFDAVKSKIDTFYSIRSLIITMCKTKSTQKQKHVNTK